AAEVRETVVRHLGLLVHRAADPMADVVANDREALALDVLLDRRADVAEAVPDPRRGDAAGERLAGDADELLRMRRHTAHRHRDRGVRVPAVDDRTRVDADDVALPQLPFPRDPVDDLLVHRGADRG